MSECGVIYRIICRSTGGCYIGSARNLRNRWKSHISLLRKGKHHSLTLQQAFNKHGEDAFLVEVIEQPTVDQLLVREQALIDAKWPHLYNSSPTAESRRGMKMPDSAKLAIKESLRGNQRRRGIPHDEASKNKIAASLRRSYAEGRHKLCSNPENLREHNEAVKRGDRAHPSKNPARDAAITAMHAATRSPSKTGAHFGITAAAVWHVVKRCNPSQFRKRKRTTWKPMSA